MRNLARQDSGVGALCTQDCTGKGFLSLQHQKAFSERLLLGHKGGPRSGHGHPATRATRGKMGYER